MLKIKSVKPLFTGIVTTTDRYDKDLFVNGIIQNVAGKIKEYQKVVAVGDTVRGIKVGDLVVINPVRYMKKKYNDNSLREDIVDNPTISIDIPVITMESGDYFLIEDRDVSYVISDFEEVPDEEPKVKAKTAKLILPKSKIVTD